MYTDEDLDSAVAAGVVSAETAAAMRSFWQAQQRSPQADERLPPLR